MNRSSFVAIDVETANRHRGSICCIGLAVVDDGRVVATEQWLTRPPDSLSEFEGINIGIHGIHAADVEHQPPFRDRLDQLIDLVQDRPLVAHNASFDTSALRQACEAEELPIPPWPYTCSLEMAKRAINSDRHTLDAICQHLGIPLEHHQAGADAYACAQVTLHVGNLLGADDLPALVTLLDLPLYQLGVRPPRPSNRSTAYLHVEDMPQPDVDADVNHPLYGQAVTFTGAFTVPKHALWDMCAAVGAEALQNVTRKTTVLVVGDGYNGDPSYLVTGKAAKALDLKAKGQPIDILTEEQFLELLGLDAALDVGLDWL
jgi:DNA polymerase-3 subunit epsilon